MDDKDIPPIEVLVSRHEPKLDWKQWIPAYGFYQANKDYKAGKPTIFDDPWTDFGSLAYLAISTGYIFGAAVYKTYEVLEPLL